MDYMEFFEKAPQETQILMNEAIKIFDYIHLSENDLYELEEVKGLFGFKRQITMEDKAYISLFLASLALTNNVQKLMNHFEIYYENCIKFLRPMGEINQNLNEKTIKKYFDEYFSHIICKLLIKGNNIIENIKDLTVEKIVYYIPLNNDMIDCMFYLNNMIGPSDIYSTTIFKEIKNVIDKQNNPLLGNKNALTPNGSNFDSLTKLFNIGDYTDINQTKTSNNNEEKINRARMRIKDNISKYGEFLTDKSYITNPAIGRDKEIENLMLTLVTPEKSAILVGKAGVGKTAVVDGLAYLISKGEVPKLLKDKEIVSIDISGLVAGQKHVGDFEKKVQKVLDDIIKYGNCIVFMDEIHRAVGMGASEKDDNDLANILKPYLSSDKIKVIGATTNYEYERNILKDSAFKRRFERINIKEPTKEVTFDILKGTIPKIEIATKVDFNFNENDADKILKFIVDMTSNDKSKYFNDKSNNPDLALSILKKAFAYAALYDKDEVSIEDIKNAILNSDRLYEVTRKRKSQQFIEMFNKKDDKSPKIIKLPIKSI